jgi:hypothetical protein
MAKKLLVVALIQVLILCGVWLLKDFDQPILVSDYEARPDMPCVLERQDNEKVIANTILIIKVWGILKYYNEHTSNAGNWDTSLMEALQKVFDGKNGDAIASDMISNFKVAEVADSKIDKAIFTNVDVCWLENSGLSFKNRSDLIRMVYRNHN